MDEVVCYKMTCFGGVDGNSYEERCFVSEKAARENALRDSWRHEHELYKVTMYADEYGEIHHRTEYLFMIPNKREFENGMTRCIFDRRLSKWVNVKIPEPC